MASKKRKLLMRKSMVFLCLLILFEKSYASGCDLAMTSPTGNFSSPGYPSKFLSSKVCNYRITVPAGKTIQLNFIDFDLGQLGCSYAEFKVYEGTSSSGKLVLTKCGGSRDPFLSEGNSLFIAFKAVYMTTPGFQIEYAARQGCNMQFDKAEGTFTSPNFPSNYPDGTLCTYKISAPVGSRIHLIFSKIYLKSSSACSGDKLSIFEGVDASGTAAVVKCGRNTTQYLSRGKDLFLQFTSDSAENEEGFKVFYVVGNAGCDRAFLEASGNISSALFPSNYPNNARCSYKIIAPIGHLIQLSFRSFTLPGYGDMDRLKIYEGSDESGLLADSRTWAINYPYISNGRYLFLVFQTDAMGTAKGFDIEFKIAKGCNIHLTAVNGVFASPLYPYSYANNTECNYTITLQPGRRVHLYFQKFELEDAAACSHDSVKIFEGSGAHGILAETLCGTMKNKQFISAGNQIFIQFKTNNKISRGGFLANYYTTQLNCDGSYTAAFGSIQSQNHPNNYPNSARCTYQIRGRIGEKIQLIFSSFTIQDSPACAADNMKIYEERISGSSLVETRCGNKTNEFISTASKLFLVFVSDERKASSGYQIFYQVGPFGCGGIYTAEDGLITSPTISSSKYPNNAVCKYRIAGATGKKISLIFNSFSLQYHETCKFDSLEIYEGNSDANGTLKSIRCGSEQAAFLSRSNQIFLVFRSDQSESGTGFRIYYYIGDNGCNQKISASSGTIKSPAYPSPYPNNAFCTYLIEVAAGNRIKLTFQRFSLQICCSPGDCDTLKIYNGASSSKSLLRSMCGPTSSAVVSSSNKMFLEFRSDGSTPNYGFIATFETVGPGVCIKEKPCKNNGTCIERDAVSYKCNCLPEYSGVNCTSRFIPCASTPCLNGGSCKDLYDANFARFECICKDGFTGSICQSKFDVCANHSLDRRWQRSIGYKIKEDAASKYCDNTLRTSWYRFVSNAGSDMPLSCPAPNTCGTTGPIWLNGTLPKSPGEATLMRACLQDGVNCCASSWNIRVKKCGSNGTSFFVYQLFRPPSCPMAYCAGTEVPCPDGWNSPNGFTPGCTNNFPNITSKPRISPGVEKNKLTFKCEFESDAKDESAIFEVTWFEGSPLKKINQTNFLKGRERMALLRNKQNSLFRLGTTIFCRIRSWYEGNVYTVSKSRTFESNHYFAGLKVEPNQLRYSASEAGKPLQLKVIATVPIVCSFGKSCKVVVELDQSNMEAFLNRCSIEFNAGPANQTKIVEVVAKRDFVIDGNKTLIIRIKVVVQIDPVDWENHHPIKELVVIVIDIHTERCTSSGDPHLMTFDKLYFNHYKIGDYVLVNSTCRIFEVHVRTWKCAAVTCNCGIAAREGNDVIVVDMCRDGVPRARFASKSKPARGTSIKRDESGKSFFITFPSGAFIRMDNYRWYGNTYYANIVVQVASDDLNCTVGLCGTFDRNQHNDMKSKNGKIFTSMDVGLQAPLGFTESWKLPVGKSLFYYKEKESNCNKSMPVKRYCTCKFHSAGPSKASCDYKSIAHRPNYMQGLKTWTDLEPSYSKACERRKKRSVDRKIPIPKFDERGFHYVYNPEQINYSPTSWPTNLGKSKSEVETYCSNKIRSSEPGKICSAIPEFDFLSYIKQCVEDVQITDDFAFSTSAVRSMQDACEETFLKNLTYWSSSANGTLAPPKEIAETLCPGLCNGNGKCIKATCICDANYTSADCSIRKNKGPSVVSVSRNGNCDARNRNDCNVIWIKGYDFIDTKKLACRLTKIEVTSSGYTKTSQQTLHMAYLLSFAEVYCQIGNQSLGLDKEEKHRAYAAHEGYLVEVTNDRIAYSKEVAVYIIYDSKCITCNASDVVCKIKDGTCSINGFCYKSREASRSDRCAKCSPNLSQTTFTMDSTCQTKSNVVVIVASSVAASLVLLVLLVVILVKVKKRKTMEIQPANSKVDVGRTFRNPAFEGKR